MPDLRNRATEAERMDDLQVSGPDLEQALRELEIINYLLGGNYVTLNGVDRLLRRVSPDAELHIADLGCGSGNMLKLLRKRMEKRKRKVKLTGIDANPNVVAFAQANTPDAFDISFQDVDISSEAFRALKFDIVTASLFFHHFTSDQLTRFFKQLTGQVSLGFVINDIHRHWFSYYSIKALTALFSHSPMVKNDASLSVARAFRKSELSEILSRAGIEEFTIRWCWAFRWQVIVPIGSIRQREKAI
jgi:2-polyprenyl-3-methyl-5-hydroxy-6-metoxy-1,4-benzoquinol methylase